MSKLIYTNCNCIQRGDTFISGMRGHLSIVIAGKVIPIRKCVHCNS